MADERPVQHRDCPTCGVAQSRRQGSDGKFKRWSKCDCPARKKSGTEAGTAELVAEAGEDSAPSDQGEPPSGPPVSAPGPSEAAGGGVDGALPSAPGPTCFNCGSSNLSPSGHTCLQCGGWAEHGVGYLTRRDVTPIPKRGG